MFGREDARKAANNILGTGAVRIKNPLSSGGGGQRVATTAGEVEALLDGSLAVDWAHAGLVIELNLRGARTLSIGRVAIDNVVMTYHGTQSASRDNHGWTVYAGSDLVCVRGDWGELERLPMAVEARFAVAQARKYDAAAAMLPGFMASRRNYDVGQGNDSGGNWHSGVLESSWRSGGASPAEVAAVELFRRDQNCHVVKAATVKKFGLTCTAPKRAILQYWGDDPDDGPILRYTIVKRALAND